MDIFTSISLNYLSKARVLAESIKNFHPDWKFHLVISDRLSNENDSKSIEFPKDLFDRIVWIDEFEIQDIYGWIFKHTVVEICTAVKGIYLKKLINEGVEKVIYLDPDIAVFNSLDPLMNLLEDHAILLTPHLLDYSENKQSILDNEIMGVLRHGIFNLGFFALNFKKPDGHRFAEWWGQRLFNYCYADYDQGLFTDQKWCDLVPAYFEDYYVLRNPGYNVASWNIDKRSISISENGQIQVNNEYPLRFFHFTGYDSGAGASMTHRYNQGNQLINEIWDWYGRKLQENGQSIYGNIKSFYNNYDNGIEITKDARQIYRQRKDLQDLFPNPYKTIEDNKYSGSFYSWYNHNKIKPSSAFINLIHHVFRTARNAEDDIS
jgi:lipopolysaccharide biosynthesis glycosyltransferase